MKNLIVANWKMNPENAKEAKKLFDAVKKGIRGIKNSDVVICPPFVYVSSFKFHVSGLALGAQDVFWEDKGAYTGEVSPSQLQDEKVEYVIVGHSERRKYFGETDETINKKLKKVLAVGLKPILCVGENEGEDPSSILEKQITGALKNISRDGIKHITIAYEPVWAIGTGNNCSPDKAMTSLLVIKKLISQLYNRELADAVRVLYGGSVSSQNSARYIKEAGFNGLLVGGASLKADEFTAIVKSIEK